MVYKFFVFEDKIMRKTVFYIMLISACSKLLGFGRELSLSYVYGASNITDAYLISVNLPNLIFGILAVGLSASFIPKYNEIFFKKGKEEADKFTSNLLNILFIITTIIIIMSLFFMKKIILIIAPGFTEDIVILAAEMATITIFAIYINGIVSVMSGYLQINNRYNITVLNGLFLNIIIIITIFISKFFEPIILAYGFLLGIISKIIIMIPSIKRENFKHKIHLTLRDENLRSILLISIPVIVGASLNQINQIIDQNIASRLAVGGISALNYASRMNEMIQGFFILPLILVMYPKISKIILNNDVEKFKKTFSSVLISILCFIIPVSIWSMIFSNQIINFLFGRGAFDSRAIKMTSEALFFYSIGMIGIGLREVLSRVFYSMQDTKTPMINAIIGVLLNIVLNFLLSNFLGIGGLALATSIAAIVTTGLLFISLRKRIGPIGMKEILISFLKILLASSILAFISMLSFDYLSIKLTKNVSFFIATFLGFISFIFTIYFMKIKDIELLILSLKKKIKIIKD